MAKRMEKTKPEPEPEISKSAAAAEGSKPEAFVIRGDSQTAAQPKRRLSFNVTNEGKVDWDSMKGANKTALIELFKSDPEISRLAGRDVPAEEIFQFTPKDIKEALGILNGINSFSTRFFFARFKGLEIDPDILEVAFSLDPEDEKILSERGSRLANRYTSEWMRQHAELIMFMVLYFRCVTKQTMTAVMAQVVRNQGGQQPASAKPPNGQPAMAPAA